MGFYLNKVLELNYQSVMSEIQNPLSETDRNVKQSNPTKQQVLSLECDKSADYFRNLLKDTRTQLTAKCDIWNKVLEENDENMDENVKGSIRTVVGQANLVMKERGKQFEQLINSHEFATSEKVINSSDLQGFWDMIYFQVEDVEQKFKDLQERKENNWAEKQVEAPKPKPKKPKATKKVKKVDSKPLAVSEMMKQKRMEARKRLKAARMAMQNNKGEMKEPFDAGFFKIESPVKENVRPFGSATKNLNVSLKQSPLVTGSNRKKPVTPSSNNFLHGRAIRNMTSQSLENMVSKKKLQFHVANDFTPSLQDEQVDQPAQVEPKQVLFDPPVDHTVGHRRSIGNKITEGGDNSAAGLSPKKKTKKETDEVVGSKGDAKLTDVAKEILSSPKLQQQNGKTEAGDSRIINKLEEMQKIMNAGFENMNLQISKIPLSTSKTVKFQKDSSIEPTKLSNRQGVIEENKKLKEEVESLKAQLSKAQSQEEPYKAHYMRVVSQCKVYQARLETYQKLLPHVPQHQANVARVTKVIKEKTEQLQQKH